MTLLRAAAAAALALSIPSVAHAQKYPPATAILDEWRQALGSEAALAKVKNARFTAKATIKGFPGEGTVVTTFDDLGNMRATTVFDSFGRFEHGVTFKTVWEVQPQGAKVKTGWTAAADVRGLHFALWRPWTEMYSEAETVAHELFEDGERYYVVELKPKTPKELGLTVVDGEEAPPPDRWYFGHDHRVVRFVSEVGAPMGPGRAQLVVNLSDYREVDGVWFPFVKEMTVGGITVTEKVQKIELGVKLDGDLFMIPDAVAVALSEGAGGEAALPDPGFQFVEREELHVATIRAKCTTEGIPATLASILPEVMAYVQSCGAQPAGPPFTRYHAWGDELDIEVGIPVAAPIKPKGRIKASKLPGGKFVSGFHVGPYQVLPTTYERLEGWLGERGLEPLAGSWEFYWTDPGTEPDPKKWRTEIVAPYQKKPEKRR